MRAKCAIAAAFAGLLLLPINLCSAAHAADYTVLYTFSKSRHGTRPSGGLVADKMGNLFGSAGTGGDKTCDKHGCGTIFKLAPDGTQTALYAFKGGIDGAHPDSDLIMDKAGNLYGTTVIGGASDFGTVFKLAPDGTEIVLYAFKGGQDGALPRGRLHRDSAGNIYGTTEMGGTYGHGTAFKITPDGREAILHAFVGGSDGNAPDFGMIADNEGNLFGATYAGGDGCPGKNAGQGCGTIFKLSPDGIDTVVYAFKGGSDGMFPTGLISDKEGSFLGTTILGGGTGCIGQNGCGTVFSLSADGKERVLYAFKGGSDGEEPESRPLKDSKGNTFGTTALGGDNSCNKRGVACGTVFMIAPDGAETVLHTFQRKTGWGSFAKLILGRDGSLYGTTSEGGRLKCKTHACGVIFKLTP